MDDQGLGVRLHLFGWLSTLYPVWARLTPEDVEAAAAVALGELALTGCTTAADHHYVVPGGDDSVFDAIAASARTIGVRAHIARGSMDLGQSNGGAATGFGRRGTRTRSSLRPRRSTTGCTTASGSRSLSRRAARSV